MNAPIDATLIGYGRLPWRDTYAALVGCTCAWMDLDGFQVDTPPTESPIATHLWAWDTNWLWRARIDAGHAVLAQLRLASATTGTGVRVIQRSGHSWPMNEHRVSVADRWRGRAITIYEVVGTMPLSFARLDG